VPATVAVVPTPSPTATASPTPTDTPTLVPLLPDFTPAPSTGPTPKPTRVKCTPTTASVPYSPEPSASPVASGGSPVASESPVASGGSPTPEPSGAAASDTPAPTTEPTTTPTPAASASDVSAPPSAAAPALPAVAIQSALPTAPVHASTNFALCVPVLEYHRIVPSAEAGNSLPGLVVPPETFSAQLDALKAAGWHTITMATLAEDLAARRAPSARSFVITIDDGWYDGYTYALPILQRHGYVATYFVISSRIGAADFLSAANLKGLMAAGNEIGNHTVDHLSLPYLTAANMTREVDLASDQIEAATGVRPKSFAYPMGGIDTAAMQVVAACPGMMDAVTEWKTIGETYNGRYDIPRLEIGPGVSGQTLLVMLAG
jgi:peptidoglycan/xylan/chitin deacetylase (PgdA/CDA1 family)